MGDKSEKRENCEKHSKCNGASKTSSVTCDAREKTENFKDSQPSSKDITALISAAEKKIKEFFDMVTKRVSDFLDKDLQQLKEVSKDELVKINVALIDYKTQLEKISQEKIKLVADMQSKLHTRIMTAEEVQSLVKYFDEKMMEVKKITNNIITTMRKNKAADDFATELQTLVADYSKKVTRALGELFNALKVTAGDLSKSMPDKKTLMTKIPTTSALQRMPSKLSNVFKKFGGSSSSSTNHDYDNSRQGPSMPATLRGKLPTLNLSRHFNSQTMYGRANVAKATYAGVLLYFLYWKFKKSKS